MVMKGQAAPLTIPSTPCKLMKFLEDYFTTELNKIVGFETICGVTKCGRSPECVDVK